MIETHADPEQRVIDLSDGFEPVRAWPHVPHGVTFASAATSVAVGTDDTVYVFNRGSHPVVAFDRDGRFLTSWEDPESFGLPHAATAGPDGSIYLVDAGRNAIERRREDGQLVMRLAADAPKMSGEPFNLPTDVAIHGPTGDIFVTDGYGNGRVHRFDANGSHILSWGSPGTGPGQFVVPHGICVINDEFVAVCDRENYRVQIFSLKGDFVTEWHAFRPASIKQLVTGADPILVVAEMNPTKIATAFPGAGHKVGFYRPSGERLGSLGFGLLGEAPDQFINPHSIAFDSAGDLYIAESTRFVLEQLGMEIPLAREIVTLRKWRRIS